MISIKYIYIYIFIFIIGAYIFNQYVFYDKFEYINYNYWKKNLNNKQIYVFNNNNYCFKTNPGIFYDNYLCCQNVELSKNYLNISELKEYSDTNLNLNTNNEIIFINEKNNSISPISLFITIVISIVFLTIIVFYNFYRLVLNFIANLLDLKKNAIIDNTNDYNNKNTISDTSTESGNLFEYIFGNETSIIVKKNPDPNITIDNFVGCSNIKKDINKLILQINYELIYKKNGCELPKGILLLGPPGVGKTHLVKTIINATGMNYIFISGSDFNKKYVGSGSSTVSKLFKKARENKPCLIFVDEADTILKKREHAESSPASIDFNSTICKFLEEMDSLKTESGIVLVFASNMDIDHVDKGIIRSGRVDQIINIGLPTFEERIELFKMYLSNLYDSSLIDLNKIAKLSYGLTGSDIKKIINLIKINKVHTYIDANQEKLKDYKVQEPKLIISDEQNINIKELVKESDEESNEKSDVELDKESNKESDLELDKELDRESNAESKEDKINVEIKITTDDIDKEISKCILGMERDRKVNEMNKKIIAYHEAGHAVLGFLISNSIIPTKICISINSKSLGYTLFPQDDDDLLVKTTISQLLTEVMILYGGRMSEKIFIGDITCGAEDDYSRARKILKRLLMNGMLILENNYVEYGEKDNKMNEEMEKNLKQINKIIIEEIEKLFVEYDKIIHAISNEIIEYGSITSDDIYKIFNDHNLNNKIGSYNISVILNEINKILKV